MLDYCHTHDRRWDRDNREDCPQCAPQFGPLVERRIADFEAYLRNNPVRPVSPALAQQRREWAQQTRIAACREASIRRGATPNDLTQRDFI
jgi:hypothetical protein